MKVFEKEINFIEGRSSMHLKMPAFQKRQLAIKVDNNCVICHYIDEDGCLKRISDREKKSDNWSCTIY